MKFSPKAVVIRSYYDNQGIRFDTEEEAFTSNFIRSYQDAGGATNLSFWDMNKKPMDITEVSSLESLHLFIDDMTFFVIREAKAIPFVKEILGELFQPPHDLEVNSYRYSEDFDTFISFKDDYNEFLSGWEGIK